MRQQSVQVRINEIKEFLAEQEIKKKDKIAEVELTASVGFLGQLQLMNEKLATNNYYQNLSRIRWEKDNAVAGDLNVHDWNEAVVPDNSIVTFSFVIPEGWVLHIRECGITYADDSTYDFVRDGRFEPTMVEFFQDYADHYKIFNPPLRAYSTCIITALNLSGNTNTYSIYFSGFLRRYQRVGELIEEETTLIEKSIKITGAVA